MNITREEKKAEAVARMKALGIYPPIVRQLEKSNLVSESASPIGACFWLNEEQMKRVREFKAEHNALVYHVIHSYTTLGEMESYLYVSDYKEEWADDRTALAEKEALAYVVNLDAPDCSELGYIGIDLTSAKGLRRTW